jgi:hypothetical protein
MGEPAADEHEPGEHQDVSADHPLQAGHREVQAALDRRVATLVTLLSSKRRFGPGQTLITFTPILDMASFDYETDLQVNAGEIASLDPDADDYDATLAGLRAERQQIKKAQAEAEPDEVKRHQQGTIAEQWETRDQAARRELLLELG